MPTNEQRQWADKYAPEGKERMLLPLIDASLREMFPHLHSDPYDLIRAIQLLYRVPDRPYHSFEHVLDMLRYSFVFNWDLQAYEVVAILFHDVVYKVGEGPGANEQDSADVLECLLGQFAPFTAHGSDFAKARLAILDTAYFLNPDRARPGSHRVLDLDLSSLASKYQKEWTYNRVAIAREFPNWTPAQDRKFFEVLMKRERIFFHAGLEHEAQARTNITAYLKRLDEMEANPDGANEATG